MSFPTTRVLMPEEMTIGALMLPSDCVGRRHDIISVGNGYTRAEKPGWGGGHGGPSTSKMWAML